MTVELPSSSVGTVRVPPHNLEAERSVLGCCLLDPAALLVVIGLLKQEDFFHPPHRHIFEAIKRLFNENVQPDYVSLTNALVSSGHLEDAGGPDYVIGLTNVVPSIRNAEHYARIVREKSQLRKIVRLGGEMAAFAGEDRRPLREILDWASNRFLELLTEREHKSYTSIGDASADYYARYSDGYDLKELPGIPSGYKDLDQKLLGFQPGNFIVLAARPSQGKTALALDICRNMARSGRSVAFVSLEMSKDELVVRLLCAEGKIDSYRLRQKRLKKEKDETGLTDWERVQKAMRSLSGMRVFIDDSSALTISELRAKVKAIALEHRLDIVIIDYLQLIDGELGGRETRVQEVSKISRNLKALARELKVPVIALSQLSRLIERREGRVPVLSDLRESGAIEQDADVVMFIHREISEEEEKDASQYEPQDVQDTQLIIAKNRNGAIGRIHLEFFRRYATFEPSVRPPVTYPNV